MPIAVGELLPVVPSFEVLARLFDLGVLVDLAGALPLIVPRQQQNELVAMRVREPSDSNRNGGSCRSDKGLRRVLKLGS